MRRGRGREGGREGDRETERERGHVCVCVRVHGREREGGGERVSDGEDMRLRARVHGCIRDVHVRANVRTHGTHVRIVRTYARVR